MSCITILLLHLRFNFSFMKQEYISPAIEIIEILTEGVFCYSELEGNEKVNEYDGSWGH